MQESNSKNAALANKMTAEIKRSILESQLFTKRESERFKAVMNDEWPKLKAKVNNLANEVFEEVLEHEMALAGLTEVNLE